MPATHISTPEILGFFAAVAAFLGWFVVTVASVRKPDGKPRR